MSSASTLGTMSIACALALGNGSCAHAARTPKIDVQHVAIELRFDEAARQAIGEARLTLAPLAATPEVRLDAVRLAIESVQLEGGAALPFTLDPTAEDEALAIRLPRTWAAGERLALTIRYRTGWVNTTNPAATWGSNGRGLRFLAPSHGDPLRPRQIWPGNEPGSARRWFPGHDVPGDLRTSEFTATVPRPLGVAASGRRVQVRDNADGTRTYRFRTDVPEPNQRSTFVAGEFAEITQQAGPVTLTSLGYPHERAGVEASVGMLPAMVAYFSQWLDEPFPHRGYTQVFVPELPWHTLGTGIAINTENMVDDFGTHADFHYLWHGLQAESLLQQWFGGLVAPCAAHEAWLERGLAHHLAGLWTEHLHGRAEFLLWYLQADQATAIADWQQGTRESLAEPAPPDLAAFVNGNTPYARAGAVLQMLRRQLGDARWREALRHFVRTNRGRLVCSAALQRSVEAASGERRVVRRLLPPMGAWPRAPGVRGGTCARCGARLARAHGEAGAGRPGAAVRRPAGAADRRADRARADRGPRREPLRIRRRAGAAAGGVRPRRRLAQGAAPRQAVVRVAAPGPRERRCRGAPGGARRAGAAVSRSRHRRRRP
jgi:aminopeptidase N